MRGNGVAAEEDLHVAVANQLRQQRSGAAVDDGGAGDDEYFAVARTNLAHLFGYFLDDQALGVFGGDIAAHEAEDFAFPRALRRQDADAIVADSHEFSLNHRRGWNHASLAMSGVDDDCQIHLGILDVDPAAAEAHLRGQVGGGVEVRRQNAIGGRREVSHVGARGQHGAERLQGQQDRLQLFSESA